MHSLTIITKLHSSTFFQVLSLRIAEDFLGKTCYVGWPHMVEALVVGVCDGIKRYMY